MSQRYCLPLNKHIHFLPKANLRLHLLHLIILYFLFYKQFNPVDKKFFLNIILCQFFGLYLTLLMTKMLKEIVVNWPQGFHLQWFYVSLLRYSKIKPLWLSLNMVSLKNLKWVSQKFQFIIYSVGHQKWSFWLWWYGWSSHRTILLICWFYSRNWWSKRLSCTKIKWCRSITFVWCDQGALTSLLSCFEYKFGYTKLWQLTRDVNWISDWTITTSLVYLGRINFLRAWSLSFTHTVFLVNRLSNTLQIIIRLICKDIWGTWI